MAVTVRQITPMGGRPKPGAGASKSVRGRASTDLGGDVDALEKKFLSAEQATAILGVKPQTLYSYVSRGLVRTARSPGRKTSLYSREDVQSVAYRSRKGNPDLVGGEYPMQWGAGLVLPTAISSIEDRCPRYRGHNAVDLARSARTFEDTVELLWAGLLPQSSPVWAPVVASASFLQFAAFLPALARQTNSRRLLALITEAYTATAGGDAEFALGAPALAARQLIQVMIPIVGLLRPKPVYQCLPGAEPLALKLARAGGVAPSAEVRRGIDACLVLSADNGLSTSTFAARIAASAGADIFSCVNTALGAFEGLLTGLGCDQAEDLLARSVSANAYVGALRQRLERRELLPGYNSPLYPQGDARAEFLMDAAVAVGGRSAAVRRILDMVQAASAEVGARPGLSIGLIAMSTALRLPGRSPGALMAIARCAGWVAHAAEQRMGGYMARPKTIYVGQS